MLSYEAVEAERRSRLLSQLFRAVREHKWTWVLALYAVLFLSSCFALVVAPSGILWANRLLGKLPEAKIKWLLEITLSVRHLFIVGFFAHHRRVLDSWVRQRAATARARFARNATVQDREIHVPLPTTINGELVTNTGVGAFKPLFYSRLVRLLILGEGGVGKTSLACQLGKWAMSERKGERLTSHLMLPVLIQEDITDSFLERVLGKLKELVEDADGIDRELFLKLLERQRVLVIVDGLSEMSDEAHQSFSPVQGHCPISALVVTSRASKPELGSCTKVQPTRLNRSRISTFMEMYVSQIGKSNLFTNDETFFDACRGLKQMVGERDMTALLAKLYIDQLVASHESARHVPMPENIPDMMFRYLDELHKNADYDKKREVQCDAQEIAWLCMKERYAPATITVDAAIESLGGDDAAKSRIAYLESAVQVIRREGRSHDQIQFALDPLVEYLAALKVVRMYKGHEKNWRSFLRRADARPPENTKGFLLAVRDCCLTESANVPAFVPEELGKRCVPTSVATG